MRSLDWMLGSVAAPVVALGLLAGCGPQPAGTPYTESEAHADDDEHVHAGHEEGPHGGHVVELADDHSVHGEFMLDTAAKQAKFYVLGSDLKTPMMASAVTFHVYADSAESTVEMTPAGGKTDASEFTAPLAGLPSSDIEQLRGHFHVTVAGKEMEGELVHDHDHVGHDHDEHGDHAH